MSFKAYTVTPLASGQWRLTHPLPVRFSGRNGLVARHVAALASHPAAAERWSATDEDWLRLLAPDSGAARWIVFEQVEEESTLRLSRLTAINGLAHAGRTELLLQFSPLAIAHPTPVLLVTVPPAARAWSEGLALDGCAERAEAHWLWCQRTLNLGAAVLGRA